MSKQDRYTKSARGKPCQLRIPGVCNHDNQTTVLCHLNGAGMARKHHNIHAAYGCSACHAWVDGGYTKDNTPYTAELWHLQGVIRTQEIMIKEGILKL